MSILSIVFAFKNFRNLELTLALAVWEGRDASQILQCVLHKLHLCVDSWQTVSVRDLRTFGVLPWDLRAFSTRRAGP